jgi:hypothetical protein
MHATKMQHIKHDNAKCFVHGLKLDMTNEDSTVDGLSVTQGWSERGFIKGVFVILGVECCCHGTPCLCQALLSSKTVHRSVLCICGVCTAFASNDIVGATGMFPSSTGIDYVWQSHVPISWTQQSRDPKPIRQT